MTSAVWAIACVAASAALASAFDIGVQSCAQGTWAVTFDDGPAQFTPEVLKHLSDAGVQATFFVIGKQLEDPEHVKYLQDAFAAGHQIASHSYTHANLNELDEAGITKEMKDTEEKIVAAIGKVPNYMRPPFGECSSQCASVVESLGYTPAMWNIDSRDWTHAPTGESADQILEDIKRYLDGKGPVAKPTDPEGVISLSHDIHGFSVERLPQILEYIKEQGYKFSTVADCATDGRAPAYKDDPAGTATTPALESAVPDSAPSVVSSAVPSYAPTFEASPTPAYDSGEEETPSYDSGEEATPADGSGEDATSAYGSGEDATSAYGSGEDATSAYGSGEDGAASQPTASPTPASGTSDDSSSPAGSSASPSPTATDSASPSPAASDVSSAASADSTVEDVLSADLQSGGVVSRPGLLISLVAPVAALLGFARML